MTSAYTRRQSTVILLALAVIAALGSMAIHMLVPALPGLAHDFGLAPGTAQLTISVYMIALGGAQLLAGPAADRLGRRPVLIVGMVLYMAGALACVVAPSLPLLLLARAVQAMGGAAGVVTARVMVGDVFGRDQAAERQASLMMVVLISPALSPVIGGFLAGWAGWRAIPVALAGAVLVAAVAVLRALPDVATPPPATRSFRADYGRLWRNRQFVLTVVAVASASSALYMFLANGAFLLVRDMGLSERATGACFLTIAAASIVGTRLVRTAQRHSDALMIGVGLVLAGSVAGVATAALGLHGPVALVAPMLLVGLGAGMAGPAAMGIVVFAEEGLSGTATSLAGAVQMLASAASTMLVGLISPMTPLRLSGALTIAAALSLACAVRRLRLAARQGR